MNSATHRANLLDGTYSEVGFGFANARNYNKSGPETVVVAMYGQPLAPGASAGTKQGVPEIKAQVVPVNSSAPLIQEPATLGISRLASITSTPWILFGVGLASGLAAAFVFLKHGFAFHKLLVQGEEFIIHHPFLDIALVSLVMIGYVLSQGVGSIR